MWQRPSGVALEPPLKVEFTYSDGKVQAHKVFTLGTNYEIHAEISAIEEGAICPVEVAGRAGFGATPAASAGSYLLLGVYGSIGDLTRCPKEADDRLACSPDPLPNRRHGGPLLAGIFLPDFPDETFRIEPADLDPTDWSGKDSDKPSPLEAQLGEAQPKPLPFECSWGRKTWMVLRTKSPRWIPGRLRMVRFCCQTSFLGLRFIYDRWVHNYGWANCDPGPSSSTRHVSPEIEKVSGSAQEMQRISPLVKSIQDKYKSVKFNDPS